MNRSEIFDTVKQFLIDDFEIDPSRIRPEALLGKDIGIDSLDYVDLIVTVNEVFGFKADKQELSGVKTLDDLCNYIQQHTD